MNVRVIGRELARITCCYTGRRVIVMVVGLREEGSMFFGARS